MSIRLTYFIGMLIVCAILGSSIYLELSSGLTPCPLCILQRFAFVLLAFFFLLGIFLSSRRWGRILVNLLAFLSAVFGMTFAGRQVWLQHFHTGAGNECGVSLQYMLQVLPLNEVAQKVFIGSAECTERGWEFLSLNMAEWALLWFIAFLILTGYLFLKEIIKPQK